jgi:hypothetical protein
VVALLWAPVFRGWPARPASLVLTMIEDAFVLFTPAGIAGQR